MADVRALATEELLSMVSEIYNIRRSGKHPPAAHRSPDFAQGDLASRNEHEKL